MIGTMIAIALAQAAAAAAPAPAIQPTLATPAALETGDGWQVGSPATGCIVHAAYDGGTVLSVFAIPERAGIGFLLQNRQWSDLKEGGVYRLRIRFAGGGDWTVPAVARLKIDRDGPGLFFAMPAGALEDGRDFVADFAAASGMRIETGGATVERLALTGSHDATVALARCMRDQIDGGSANPFRDTASAETALRI